MSALTKVFVALHVLLTMILTAAFVTFATGVEDYKTMLSNEQAKSSAAQLSAERVRSEATSQLAEANNNLLAANNRASELRAQLAAAQTSASQQAVQLIELQSKDTLNTATVNKLGNALAASEAQKTQLQTTVADLRSRNDDLLAKYGDSERAVADLTNRYEQTLRQMRFYAEQLTQAEEQVGLYRGMLDKAGINPRDPSVVASATPPPINGVVKDRMNIEGREYATISVGSADSVRPGMEFRVIDRDNGIFLGLLRVDSVEANEATGRLEGPRVAEVRAGHEVRTQL